MKLPNIRFEAAAPPPPKPAEAGQDDGAPDSGQDGGQDDGQDSGAKDTADDGADWYDGKVGMLSDADRFEDAADVDGLDHDAGGEGSQDADVARRRSGDDG